MKSSTIITVIAAATAATAVIIILSYKIGKCVILGYEILPYKNETIMMELERTEMTDRISDYFNGVSQLAYDDEISGSKISKDHYNVILYSGLWLTWRKYYRHRLGHRWELAAMRLPLWMLLLINFSTFWISAMKRSDGTAEKSTIAGKNSRIAKKKWKIDDLKKAKEPSIIRPAEKEATPAPRKAFSKTSAPKKFLPKKVGSEKSAPKDGKRQKKSISPMKRSPSHVSKKSNRDWNEFWKKHRAVQERKKLVETEELNKLQERMDRKRAMRMGTNTRKPVESDRKINQKARNQAKKEIEAERKRKEEFAKAKANREAREKHLVEEMEKESLRRLNQENLK